MSCCSTVNVTPVGAALAGVLTDLAGDDPRPAFLAAGALVLLTVAVAWRHELHNHR